MTFTFLRALHIIHCSGNKEKETTKSNVHTKVIVQVCGAKLWLYFIIRYWALRGIITERGSEWAFV